MRAVRNAFASLFLAVALAGCGGQARGVLGPVAAEVPGASKVEMLVATTRRGLPDDPGSMFSGERGPALAFADVVISIPPDATREIGEVQWPASVPGDPAKAFVATRARVVDKAQALARFHDLLGRPGVDGRALVFVHGYNSRFEDAVMRFAQIAHDSGYPGVPLLFTWPSRGRLLAYAYDRESANYSRDALEAALHAIALDPKVREIGILAHSMGNWAAMEALRTMALKRGRVDPKIANVMLAAPDVDVDVFRTQLVALGPARPRMTLFVSQDDRALGFSQRLWGDVARLGAVDPEVEPYKSAIARSGITVVDLTKLRTGDPLAHGKFAESPEVVKYIGTRLASGQTVTDSRAGLGESVASLAAGAGSRLGSVAGKVATSPLAILSQEDRDSLADELGSAAPEPPQSAPDPHGEERKARRKQR